MVVIAAPTRPIVIAVISDIISKQQTHHIVFVQLAPTTVLIAHKVDQHMSVIHALLLDILTVDNVSAIQDISMII